MKKLFLKSAFILTAALLQAQFYPGSEDFYRFSGPQALGGGMSVVNGFPGTAEQYNPAISGDNQRNTVDLQYTTLINTNGASWGNAGSLGLSLPTRAVVWNFSLWALSSDNPDFKVGTLGGVRVTLSKDVYKELLVGIGLNAGAGGRPDGSFDTMVAASLGFIHKPYLGDGLRNFRWGIAVRDMGKTFTSSVDTAALPQMFTPAIGFSFDLLPAGDFSVQVGSDLAFPFVQNLVADINTQIGFRVGPDWGLGIRSSFTFDVRDYFSDSLRKASLLPSLGIFISSQATIDTENPSLGFLDPSYKKSEFRPSFSWTAYRKDSQAFSLGVNLALGSIDANPPVIKVESEPETIVYFSPNSDGIQDEINLPWVIEDERFVRAWRMEIHDKDGQLVRVIRNKDDRPENEGLQNFIDRLLYEKKGVQIPDSIRWDGRGDNGETLENGVYSLVLISSDDNENTSEYPKIAIALDNSRPEIRVPEISDQDKIFSPDDDGRKDGITMALTGSEEKEWVVRIQNAAGTDVREFKQTDGALASVVWDGKDNQGNLVPDGVYSAIIQSTDPAGNKSQEEMRNIIVNTQLTPIGLKLSYAHFSPNQNGVRDTITFIPEIPVKEGIRAWSLEIRQGETIVKSLSGEATLPETLVWDGTATSGTANEGLYKAFLQLNYIKGNAPSAETGEFRLDRTPPVATISIDGPATFSPGGEGTRSVLPIVQQAKVADNEDLWKGIVYAGTPENPGAVVRSVTWTGNLPDRFSWDGTDISGRVVNDGNFFYKLEGSDPSGNTTSVQTTAFTVDTRERSLILSIESDAFSPNGDNKKDRAIIYPRLNITEGIGSWTLKILNDTGTLIRTFSGNRTLPASLSWDGLGESPVKAPEGNYSVLMEIQMLNGQKLTASLPKVTLDTTAPLVQMTTNMMIFSPDGDGKKDHVTMSALTSTEETWTAEVLAGERILRAFRWTGKIPGEWNWDGRDDVGNVLPDGSYNVRVFSEDRAGNAGTANIIGIRLDKRPVQLFITSDKAVVPLGRAGREGEIRWGLTTIPAEGVSQWKLEIMQDRVNTVIQTLSGEGTVPANLVWRPETNRTVPDGAYVARFSVVYGKGNEPVVTSAPVIVDNVAPVVEITTSPELFSPDDDGFQDELEIKIKVQDTSGIARWKLSVLDPGGSIFHEWTGVGTPAEKITWDGRGNNGELIQAASDYQLVLVAADRVGLESTVKSLMTTDILVIREGDRLRIAIPSIVFTASSPQLLSDNSEESRRNVRLIRRLAEVLNRFNTYQITIEGHAASLQFANPVVYEREEVDILGPLSLARAQTVKTALANGGVELGRMKIEGIGGRRPTVPHSDTPNRWKNRRVVFYLDR